MSGRVCIVTGANSGIGKNVARALAGSGATVVMVCRDRKKGEEARDEIYAARKDQSIELMFADFSSLDSVRKLASDFKKTHDKLQLMVNNAG